MHYLGFKRISVLIVLSILFFSFSFTSVYAKTFSDVSDSHWAKDAINWGTIKGAVTGFPDGTFHPKDKVTEAQFLTMLIKSYPVQIGTGSDSSWSSKYYDFAKAMNWKEAGLADSSVKDLPIKRGTAALMINYVLGLDISNFQIDLAIQNLYDRNLSSGVTSKTIEGFEHDKEMTRAEAISFIRNVVEKVSELSPITHEVDILDRTILNKIANDIPPKYGLKLRIDEFNDPGKSTDYEFDGPSGTYAGFYANRYGGGGILTINAWQTNDSNIVYDILKELFPKFNLSLSDFTETLNNDHKFIIDNYIVTLRQDSDSHPNDVKIDKFFLNIRKIV